MPTMLRKPKAHALSSHLVALGLCVCLCLYHKHFQFFSFALPSQRAAGKPAAYLQDLISVRYPYNKLEDVQVVDENSISAVFEPEQNVTGDIGYGPSATPMAELARHFAIAGSLACAMKRSQAPGGDSRHQYLAVRGKIFAQNKVGQDRFLDAEPPGPARIPVTAVCTKSGKVSAQAEITGLGVKLTLKYAVCSFPEDLGVDKDTLPETVHDHYKRTPLLHSVHVNKAGDKATVQLSGLAFPGHFSQEIVTQKYAVAAICSIMTRLIHEMLDQKWFQIQEIGFVARRLLPAAAPCTMISEILPPTHASTFEDDGSLQVRVTLTEQACDGGNKPETAAIEFLPQIRLSPEAATRFEK